MAQPLKVVFYGAVAETGGFGTAGRRYIHSLHQAGIDVSVVNLNPVQPSADPLINSLLNRLLVPDFHLIHHHMPQAALLLSLYLDRVIFVTTWETDILPYGWVEALNQTREVWVPCEYNVTTLKRQLSVPVFAWPHAAQNGCPRSVDSSELPELSEKDFVFYSIFKWQQRKNPEGTIEAFLRAFSSDPDVVLILKIQGGSSDPGKTLAKLRDKTGSSARVLVLDDSWSEEQMEALEQRGNCYVSLHHSEGWGQPLFDAACRGTPVIATAYSGPLDYLNSRDHWLVRFTEEQVKEADQWFRPPMRWAEPSVQHAAELMRQVYMERDRAGKKAIQSAERLRLQFSPQNVGGIARDRLLKLLSSA